MKARVIYTEVYSRVVGYYRPVRSWHRGKQAEFRDRVMIDVTPGMVHPAQDMDRPHDPIPPPLPYTGSPGMADDVEPLR